MNGLAVANIGSDDLGDTEEYKWKTFPTMDYFRAGHKRPPKYEGERNVEDFMIFAQHKHCLNAYRPRDLSGFPILGNAS